jgi:hypothetical protein
MQRSHNDSPGWGPFKRCQAEEATEGEKGLEMFEARLTQAR